MTSLLKYHTPEEYIQGIKDVPFSWKTADFDLLKVSPIDQWKHLQIKYDLDCTQSSEQLIGDILKRIKRLATAARFLLRDVLTVRMTTNFQEGVWIFGSFCMEVHKLYLQLIHLLKAYYPVDEEKYNQHIDTFFEHYTCFEMTNVNRNKDSFGEWRPDAEITPLPLFSLDHLIGVPYTVMNLESTIWFQQVKHRAEFIRFLYGYASLHDHVLDYQTTYFGPSDKPITERKELRVTLTFLLSLCHLFNHATFVRGLTLPARIHCAVGKDLPDPRVTVDDYISLATLLNDGDDGSVTLFESIN